MVCVQCGQKTQIFNSRARRRTNQVWRRHRCQACGAVFSSQETIDYAAIWAVTGRSGRLRPFSRDKLFLSLYHSCQHRSEALTEAAALTDTVIQKLQTEVKSGNLTVAGISRVAQVALNRFDKAASVHYQAYHRL